MFLEHQQSIGKSYIQYVIRYSMKINVKFAFLHTDWSIRLSRLSIFQIFCCLEIYSNPMSYRYSFYGELRLSVKVYCVPMWSFDGYHLVI